MRGTRGEIQGYEPFGSLLPGRNYSSDSYRFGFNGQEKDNEVYGSEGTSYTAEFWQYDPRTGRRWNLDPVPQVSISDYAAFALNPISNVDPLGNRQTHFVDSQGHSLGENNDGNNQTVTIGGSDEYKFYQMRKKFQADGTWDTKGATEAIKKWSGGYVSRQGTTGYFADRFAGEMAAKFPELAGGASSGNGGTHGGSLGLPSSESIGDANNLVGFAELGLSLGGELKQSALFEQGWRLGTKGNYLLTGRNFSMFGKARMTVSTAPLVKSLSWARGLGHVGTGLGVLSIVSEGYDYSQGQISGGRFAYHTTGTAAGIGVGFAAGGPAGFVAGGSFYIGEKGYDAMWYLAGEMSKIEYALQNGWRPR